VREVSGELDMVRSKNGTSCAHKEQQSAFPTSYSWAVVRDGIEFEKIASP
jgi:hypothetical protein